EAVFHAVAAGGLSHVRLEVELLPRTLVQELAAENAVETAHGYRRRRLRRIRRYQRDALDVQFVPREVRIRNVWEVLDETIEAYLHVEDFGGRDRLVVGGNVVPVSPHCAGHVAVLRGWIEAIRIAELLAVKVGEQEREPVVVTKNVVPSR